MCQLLSLMPPRLHFQCLCQQSSLASFSKTPQVLSLIRPFSVGKHHGNSAGKSVNLGYCNKHICTTRSYTLLLLLLEFPTSVGQLTYRPCPRGPTGQNWAVIKADTQVELLLSATQSQLRERPQVLSNTVYRKQPFRPQTRCWLLLSWFGVFHRWLTGEDGGFTFGFQVSGLCREPSLLTRWR